MVPLPGRGLVGRWDEVVVAAGPEGRAILAAIDRVATRNLAAVRAVLAEVPAGVAVAAVVLDDRPIGVCRGDGGIRCGLTSLSAMGESVAEAPLSGSPVILRIGVDEPAVGGGDGELGRDALVDLRSGIVPGGGAVVELDPATIGGPPPLEGLGADDDLLPPTLPDNPVIPGPVGSPVGSGADVPPAPSPVPPPAPPAPSPVPPPPGFESIDLAAAPPSRDPLPLGGRAPAPPPATGDDDGPRLGDEPPVDAETPIGPEVLGINCARSHLNHPEAQYCHRCGLAMVHRTHELVRGPRPALGFLVFDDGSAWVVDRDYRIGRSVEAAGGQPEPLAPTGDLSTVSSRHAEIRLDGWDLLLVDLSSTNGTFVWNEASGAWSRCDPERPTPLRPGAVVSLGHRRFVFESSLRRG